MSDEMKDVNLDELLDMGVSSEDEFNDIDTEKEEVKDKESKIKLNYDLMDVKDNIEGPNIKISVKDILNVLKVSSVLSSAGENSLEGRLVVFHVEDNSDKVKILLSDNKRKVEKSLNLIEADNIFSCDLAFSSSILSKLLRVCTSVFTLVKKVNEGKTSYVVLVDGGEIEIENVGIGVDRFKSDFSCEGSFYDKSTMLECISDLYSFASDSLKSGKSIDFVDKTIQASPMNGLAKISCEEKYPSFRLPLVDAKLLSLLCNTDTAEKIKISSGDSSKVFIGDSFKFSTEVYPVVTGAIGAVADRMFEGIYVKIDFSQLNKFVDLACSLDTATGNLKFNYTDDGNVVCKFITKLDTNVIQLRGESVEDAVVMDKDIEVSSYSLKGAMSVFSGSNVVGIGLNPDGIALYKDNIKVAILGKMN